MIQTTPTQRASIKSKTTAAWLAFLFGVFGAHRFYLFGWRDIWAWLTPIPAVAGWIGLMRFNNIGQDDTAAWVLVPVLGMAVAVACAQCIFYALMNPERWQRVYNAQVHPALSESHASGLTNWLSMIALVMALMFGSVSFMSSLVMSFQAYFESQVQAARAISQGTDLGN
jgi:TM2 domain-containing membrane protein YozV